MASRATRAQSAASGDVSWCPRPQVQRAEGALDAALEAGGSGEQFLRSVVREGPKGHPAVIAEGYAYPVAMRHKVGEPVQSWTERRWVVRSVRQAHAAALRARVAKARAQSAALTQRGRGTKRFETVSAFRQAVVAMGQRSGVAHFCWLRLSPHVTSRHVRAYRGQPVRVEHARHVPVEVCVDAAALEAAVRRLGWRVEGTHPPGESWSRAQAVLASRSA